MPGGHYIPSDKGIIMTQLGVDSVSANTRRAYSGALSRLWAWLDDQLLDDTALAIYLGELHDRGYALASAATVVAAVRSHARRTGTPSPVGDRTVQVLADFRRTADDRGRGQARPFRAADLAAVLATCHRQRRDRRGRESRAVARERGPTDAVIAGLLFMAALRPYELAALRWADVADAADGNGILITVQRGGQGTKDVRFVKGAVADAVRTLQAKNTRTPEELVVPLSPKTIGLRFKAAARAAGVQHVTAHSARIGLAAELTSRGASTADVMLAGNWKTSRMVAKYSAPATPEQWAVARYL